MLEKNPAAGVPLFNVDNKVERYLDGAELERLLQVLRTDENRTVCRIALFLLSTGCRLNEALRATWGQVDREEPGVAHPGVELEVQARALGAAERQRARGARRAGHRGALRAPVRQRAERASPTRRS